MPEKVKAMFSILVRAEVGDGTSIKFWTDRWLHGLSARDVAPSLMQHVKKQAVRSHTVHEGLQCNAWIHDFDHGLPIQTVWEFLLLWDIVQ